MPLISELYICWDVTFVDGRGGDSKRQAATRARNKKSGLSEGDVEESNHDLHVISANPLHFYVLTRYIGQL